MLLSSLYLKDFRSWEKEEFDFSSEISLIVGQNAAGKTNILEAIYLLATGRSFRARLEREMIRNGCEMGLVKSLVNSKESSGLEKRLEIILTNGEVMGKRTAKKIYKLNGIGKRKSDFIGNLIAVLFRPEDIEIVIGSPSIRRDYLDLVLEQVDREYARSSLPYKKGLRQRNKLLLKIREGEASRSQLFFWDNFLIKNGNLISDKRREFIDFLNESFHDLSVEYDASPISKERLAKYSQQEVAAGTTLVGPHRDDFIIKDKKERNLSLFGSRGEQRMAVLYLKIAELEFIEKKSGERPVLLLDDIFSELDEDHREEVLKIVPNQQTIITTTESELIEKKFRDIIKTIRIPSFNKTKKGYFNED